MPVSSEGQEPDVLAGLVVELGAALAAAALGSVDKGPARGSVDGTGVPGFIERAARWLLLPLWSFRGNQTSRTFAASPGSRPGDASRRRLDTIGRVAERLRDVVWLGDGKGNLVEWRPYMLAGAKGGVEVYRSGEIELRKGDGVRWTRNDPGLELANGETAAVESVGKDGVGFRLKDGSAAKLAEGDAQLRHLDRAWASTVHGSQGRTVDEIIAAMPTGNPDLTNQKAFYVAISRTRDAAELVTDDAWKLSDQLERATGERVAALDGAAMEAAHETAFGLEPDHERDGDQEARGHDRTDHGLEEEHVIDPERERESGPGLEPDRSEESEHDRIQEEDLEPAQVTLDFDLEM